MRISSKAFEMQWLTDIYRRQAELARVQKQVTSGRRVASAGDDPAGAAQMVTLQTGIGRLQEYAANADTARRRLTLEENALEQLGNVLDRVRELVVQAGGGNQTDADRAAIANEVRELLRGLIDIANSQDGEGRYLFAGNRVLSQPFSVVDGKVVYNGDDGVRAQRISDGRTVLEGDPGSEVFMAIRNGNGTFGVRPAAANGGTAYYSSSSLPDPSAWISDDYTITFTTPDTYEVADSSGATVASGSWWPGGAIAFRGALVTIEGTPVAGDEFEVVPSVNRSIFSSVELVATNLELSVASPQDRARLQNALNRVLQNLDQAQSHFSEIRSRVGARLAAIEAQLQANDELDLELQKALSAVRDVDLASAVSQLQTQLLGLEAAQKVFAQTRGMSLFDVL